MPPSGRFILADNWLDIPRLPRRRPASDRNGVKKNTGVRPPAGLRHQRGWGRARRSLEWARVGSAQAHRPSDPRHWATCNASAWPPRGGPPVQPDPAARDAARPPAAAAEPPPPAPACPSWSAWLARAGWGARQGDLAGPSAGLSAAGRRPEIGHGGSGGSACGRGSVERRLHDSNGRRAKPRIVPIRRSRATSARGGIGQPNGRRQAPIPSRPRTADPGPEPAAAAGRRVRVEAMAGRRSAQGERSGRRCRRGGAVAQADLAGAGTMRRRPGRRRVGAESAVPRRRPRPRARRSARAAPGRPRRP